jgi:hypothetical protein
MPHICADEIMAVMMALPVVGWVIRRCRCWLKGDL